MTSAQETSAEVDPQWQQDLEQVGFIRRLLLARRWYGERGTCPDKAERHRALDDIRESIAELRWYRQHVFVRDPTPT